jgi:hypothetical protein
VSLGNIFCWVKPSGRDLWNQGLSNNSTFRLVGPFKGTSQ